VVEYTGKEEEGDEFEVECILDEVEVGDHRLMLLKWKVRRRFFLGGGVAVEGGLL